MPQTLDKPKCLHRERTPERECESCGAYLTSANEDNWCWQCGGWTTQRMNVFDALGELPGKAIGREPVGAALGEMMVA